MKTIFRFLSLALVVAAGAVAGFGQTPAATPDPVCADVDGQNAIYTPFTQIYNKKPYTVADADKAIELGKSFLEKFGNCEPVKEQVDFVKAWVPKLEKRKVDLVVGEKYKRFNDAVNSKNWDVAFPAAKDVLAANPSDSHIMVALGLIGLDLTYQKNYKFSDQAIENAKAAIALLKAGSIKAKDNGAIGAWYECKPAECAGDLTFAVAHMTFWGKNDKAGSLPYYYEAAQLPGRNKENPGIYEAIGTYYVEQAAPIGAEIAKLIEEQKKAPDDAAKLAIDAQIKPKVALFNGYTERIIDAFGRAHKYTKDTTRKATIYKKLQDLYQQRFDKSTGLDEYLVATVAKPLPNPTTAVQPVVDPEPTPTTTTGTSTTTPAPTTTTPAKPPTKPMSTVGTKVSAADMGTNATPSETATAAKAKTVVKKPVVKKKGTR